LYRVSDASAARAKPVTEFDRDAAHSTLERHEQLKRTACETWDPRRAAFTGNLFVLASASSGRKRHAAEDPAICANVNRKFLLSGDRPEIFLADNTLHALFAPRDPNRLAVQLSWRSGKGRRQ
jgi:hypothetical protein